jgi:D-alanine-D-alanine ligase
VRVAVVFDLAASAARAATDVRAVLGAVAAAGDALRSRGHVVDDIPVSAGFDWLGALAGARPDVVFNLCEGIDGRSDRESDAAAAIESLGIRITGSGSRTLAVARRKDRVNGMLCAAGLPVPAWALIDGGVLSQWSGYPSIVKPAGEDASVGIHQTSIVRDPSALARAVEHARAHDPLLVQEYIDGREFNVGIVGASALPVAEIEFDSMPDGLWRIVSYDAKWAPGSIEDAGSRPRCPARIGEALAARLTALAQDAWTVVDGRGYGRVDLRMDARDHAWILDVNPNPDLSPDAGLARMADAAGIGYEDLIERVLAGALA